MHNTRALALPSLGSCDDRLLGRRPVAGREPMLVIHTADGDDRVFGISNCGSLELPHTRAPLEPRPRVRAGERAVVFGQTSGSERRPAADCTTSASVASAARGPGSRDPPELGQGDP
jgi:hypothetical protein